MTVGVVALDGWDRVPPATVPRAAWWRDGALYLRLPAGTDPNRYPVVIDDGRALCLTGDSAHVVGAVRAVEVEVEPGAVDVTLVKVYARAVVRDSLVASSAESAAAP